MYFVKLDLSVSGLPASATRGYTRHIVKPFLADSPFDAIDKAQRVGDVSRYTSAVRNLYHAILSSLVYDHVPATGDVVLTARYTAIDPKNHKIAATYTRYYNFDDYVRD